MLFKLRRYIFVVFIFPQWIFHGITTNFFLSILAINISFFLSFFCFVFVFLANLFSMAIVCLSAAVAAGCTLLRSWMEPTHGYVNAPSAGARNGTQLHMHSRCKRISMICEHGDTVCLTKPTSYSYNFITLVSKLSVPPNGRGLFTYKGPSWYENIDFDLKIVHVQAPSYVKSANDQYFRYLRFFFLFIFILP